MYKKAFMRHVLSLIIFEYCGHAEVRAAEVLHISSRFVISDKPATSLSFPSFHLLATVSLYSKKKRSCP